MAVQAVQQATEVTAPPEPLARYRFTRAQYERMIEAGVFPADARAELLNGEVVTMSPQRSYHATAVSLVSDALRRAYGEAGHVRTQLPLALDPDAEPEPDVAVVEGEPRDYRDMHPQTALLVVEVADTSLVKDRMQKAKVYARAGIPAYWIVNLVDECLEVYRNPAGGTYQEKTTLHRSDAAIPPERPDASVAVADLLP